MQKKVIFEAVIDTSSFDRSVEQIQQKMKAAQAPNTAQRMQNVGLGGAGMSQIAMEAYNRASQQNQRELDRSLKEQFREQEKLSKTIAQRSETLKKMQQQQKDMIKGSQEELSIKEKIARVEQNNMTLREQHRQRESALNQAIDAKEQIQQQQQQSIRDRNPAGWGRAGRFASQGMYGAAGREAFTAMGGMAGLGSGLGTLGMVGQAGAEAYRTFGRMPVGTEISMGSAVQGTMGQQASNIYGRRSGFDQIFAEERARAARQALATSQSDMAADKANMGFGLLKNIGGGMALGAGIGSMGGPLGTVGGGLLGLGKGVMDIMGNERQMSLAMSPFSSTAKKRYDSMVAEDMSKNYNQSYESQKQQNPFKFMAAQEYEQNYSRNLGAQRSMGLGNNGFYGPGGFMSSSIGAGFTPEMGLEMSGGIMGAGGSTRMARESTFGLQAQRGLNLTNASSVLGTLSGGLGSSEATKQATIKILAEGMKLGLDDSKFAEENRKFVQAAAEIVSRSGATGEDVGRVAGGFGKFVGENTTLGLGAAKTAYEQYQQISSATTGPRGTMRAAGFLADKDLSKISTMTKQALLQLPEEQLNAEHPVVQAAADEAGISASDLVGKVKGVNAGAVSRFKDADTIRDRLKAGMQKLGKERLSAEDIKNLPADMQKDFNSLTAFQTTELGNQDQRTTIARALGTINGGGPAGAGRESAITGKMNGDTGRIEDETIKAMAADSKVVLDNFNEMAPAMREAAKTTAAWTREVREMNTALMQALESARANKGEGSLDALKSVLNKMATPGNQTQQQGGKQSK